ncbi:MAG: polyprenyl synthetase family protein [Propionibacteriaceae bacterium]|jgi:geranylgeranyl diphosphate synthase type I|nr:polyprenyl synthetase family protein [Propionibacteriaceae bacterium]
MAFDPFDPAGPEFRAAVGRRLKGFLAVQKDLLASAGDRLDPVWKQVRHLAAGGKRLRPAFCYWAHAAVAGQPDDPRPLLDVAASLDLLHVSALVHDDIIDGSATRRGGPSAHVYFARVHAERGWSGPSAQFGHDAAIVLGDLALAGAVAMAERAQIAPKRLLRARPYLDAARTEVAAGQYLDILHQAAGPQGDPLEEAELVMEFKTSKYTVARPVQVGAALGLADQETLAHLGRFGSHLGHAFQMRDDVLGLFGDPAVTGKPAGGDLREGKRTVLLAHAFALAAEPAAERLRGLVGKRDLTPAEADEACGILTECGALEATERAIEAEAVRALRLLGELELKPDGEQALTTLAHAAVDRRA